MATEERIARGRMKALLYLIPEEQRKGYRGYKRHWFETLSPEEHREHLRYLETTSKTEWYIQEHKRIKWYLKLSEDQIRQLHTELEEKFAQLSPEEQHESQQYVKSAREQNIRP